MAFKKAPQSINEAVRESKEENFISQARGETSTSEERQTLKNLNVPLPLETINRLKNYQMTEGKKIETQSYIINEALNDWFRKKGYQ